MNENIFSHKVEVHAVNELLEISRDFSNPLDLVREAISNSFDARATEISMEFKVVREKGRDILIIVISDNGDGMDENDLHSFFDLGNSSRRGDSTTIGEKGHGTKVYFNSENINVVTVKNGKKITANMEHPYGVLCDGDIPVFEGKIEDCNESTGTTITIKGYNNSQRSKFEHNILKDYILWFTKFGSVEKEFNISTNENIILKLKGLTKESFETIPFGHVFPKENKNLTALFDEHKTDAPNFYCKKIVKQGHLKHFPEINYDAVFYIEGNRVKYSYNEMIRRQRYSAPIGAYTVQERYGLWLCKDYIPIQRKNEWITEKGSEYTKFHAFFNCQALELTANRGNVDNTPTAYLDDIQLAIKEIRDEIYNGDDWSELDELEEKVDAYKTKDAEKNDYKRRVTRIKNGSKIAYYMGIRLIEPRQENGVFSIFMQLSIVNPDLFDFTVVDYDTHRGIDVIVKEKNNTPVSSGKLKYVEFKNILTKNFNHSFEHLYKIICWDIDTSILPLDEEITDIANQTRKLKLVEPRDENDYQKYFLDDEHSDRKIEVIVLKHYLEDVADIKFRPRNDKDTV